MHMTQDKFGSYCSPCHQLPSRQAYPPHPSNRSAASPPSITQPINQIKATARPNEHLPSRSLLRNASVAPT